MLGQMWSAVEKNRFTVVFPLVALVIWFGAMSCAPVTFSPLDSTKLVNAEELQTDYQVWLKQNEAVQLRFESAGNDLKRQAEQQAKFQEFILSLATGQVADFGSLATMLISGGFAGSLFDNIRKNGVIAGLKRNKAA